MRGEDVAILIAGVAIILAVTGWLVMGLPAHAASCAGTIMRAPYIVLPVPSDYGGGQ